MKRHYVFASHGRFAEGILHSVELILGKQANIHTLCAYLEEEDVTARIDALMNAFSQEDEVIILTDIFAGSINNEFIRFIHRPQVHLVAGMNLPLIIEMLIAPPGGDTAALIEESLNNARESIQYCNQTLHSVELTDRDF
ncbi:PTS sugar transporter subunit IIA [Chimaeribacter arupi]|uniref:PTS sugar transporter n=2 Tax=Yersiniaceae TaxID=1903411 RepID=A0A2N5ERH2_9GAMM|nr:MULTISPECIES: PTS sugar transporter subunit IIA [Yersiniaceae]MBS0970967.1 PTS sugar transporter subunit IIA [Nissabacter archeti]MDV5139097.1 PTS sugar transporter subunit IIA [Chimaeribacter arupi]PLR29924.1 PTS sugar transporter [Chimaeribacter arupi]PLR43710.1 PTS sugar transporter [Chimaeribacter arupi]PLR52305.1 PTS sugar transporter [Chimaeribacter arupi]